MVGIFKEIDAVDSNDVSILDFNQLLVLERLCSNDDEVNEYFKGLQDDLAEIQSPKSEIYFTMPVKKFTITKDEIKSK